MDLVNTKTNQFIEGIKYFTNITVNTLLARNVIIDGNLTVTGNLTGISISSPDLSNVDNTSDLSKPISNATQQALDLKAPLNNPTFTGTVSGINKTMVGLSNVDNTTDANKPISNATKQALDLKAPLNNPTFTGTVSGINKTMVGLSNVDNTTDANKPISNATQQALDLKAPLNNPTFTGTVSGINKTMVGLSNVDNTTDASKPISDATLVALYKKADRLDPVFTNGINLYSYYKPNSQFTYTSGSTLTLTDVFYGVYAIGGSVNVINFPTFGAEPSTKIGGIIMKFVKISSPATDTLLQLQTAQSGGTCNFVDYTNGIYEGMVSSITTNLKYFTVTIIVTISNGSPVYSYYLGDYYVLF